MFRAFFVSLSLVVVLLMPVSAHALVIDCALERPNAAGNNGYCDDVNDIVLQIIVIGRYLLGLAGSIALVMFVYGGFVFLTAMGRSDQAKKGQQVLGAAVIGLVITLSAYLIVEFITASLQVGDYFTG